MRLVGIVLMALGVVTLRHAWRVPDALEQRQQNLAHQQMLAAAAARRRRR